MNRYKGVIFDLDGVICFTDKFHYKAWKAIAEEEGIYFDEQINERLKGISRMDSLDIVLERAEKVYSDEEKIVLAEKKNKIYRELLAEMSPADLSLEVKSALEQLRALGIKLAIGSSSRNTGFILNRIGLEDYFDAVSDGTNITKSKPDPEVYLKAAELIGESPADCLVVEDAPAGIDAGVAGGFDTAGIGSASKYDKTTYPIESLLDLVEIAVE